MKTYLKIKIKELSAEGQAIALERIKFGKKISYLRKKFGADARTDSAERMVNSVRLHGQNVVAVEVRHSLLAYGFIRGRSYVQMENLTYNPPIWDKVLDEATRFGLPYFGNDKRTLAQKFQEWRDTAELQASEAMVKWEASAPQRAEANRLEKQKRKAKWEARRAQASAGYGKAS